MFSKLDLVFFDTTSIYFEGQGGEHSGRLGFSKDHRPDLHQMVVGAVLDDHGRPIRCEMWPGNTTDVTTLMPEIKRLRSRFGIGDFCIVTDLGMISADTLDKLDEAQIPYISFLALVLRKELDQSLSANKHRFEWSGIKQDLNALKQVEVEKNGKRFAIRSESKGVCGKVFQSVYVALPPTIRELS